MKQFNISLRKDDECWKIVGMLLDLTYKNSCLIYCFHEWNQKKDRKSFVDAVYNLLGNMKDTNYNNIVERILTTYEAQGGNMNPKVYFLHLYLDYFR